MQVVDEVTFEKSKKQAGKIFSKLKKANMQGLRYSVIKNGIGAVTATMTLGITVDGKEGYKVQVLPRNGKAFIEYVMINQFEQQIAAILKYKGA